MGLPVRGGGGILLFRVPQLIIGRHLWGQPGVLTDQSRMIIRMRISPLPPPLPSYRIGGVMGGGVYGNSAGGSACVCVAVLLVRKINDLGLSGYDGIRGRASPGVVTFCLVVC